MLKIYYKEVFIIFYGIKNKKTIMKQLDLLISMILSYIVTSFGKNYTRIS